MGGCVAKASDGSLRSPTPTLQQRTVPRGGASRTGGGAAVGHAIPGSHSGEKQISPLSPPNLLMQLMPSGRSPVAQKPSPQRMPTMMRALDLHSPHSYLASQENKRTSLTNGTRGDTLTDGQRESSTNDAALTQGPPRRLRPAASNPPSAADSPAQQFLTPVALINPSPTTSPYIAGSSGHNVGGSSSSLPRPISRTSAPSPFPRSGSGFGHSSSGGDSSKADFLAFMAHELRNPLHNVMGVTELLLGSPLSNEQRELLESLALSSQLMSRIVDDVLDLGKMKAGHMELELMPFDLIALLRDLERMYTRIKAAPTAPNCSVGTPPPPPRVEWSVRIHENLCLSGMCGGIAAGAGSSPSHPRKMLIGDATRLMQILTNLLSNAFKFTTRGKVALFVRAVAIDEDGNSVELEEATPPYSRRKLSNSVGGHNSDPMRPRALPAAMLATHMSSAGYSSTDTYSPAAGGTASGSNRATGSLTDLPFDPRPDSRTASRATILEHVRGSPFLGSAPHPPSSCSPAAHRRTISGEVPLRIGAATPDSVAAAAAAAGTPQHGMLAAQAQVRERVSSRRGPSTPSPSGPARGSITGNGNGNGSGGAPAGTATAGPLSRLLAQSQSRTEPGSPVTGAPTPPLPMHTHTRTHSSTNTTPSPIVSSPQSLQPHSQLQLIPIAPLHPHQQIQLPQAVQLPPPPPQPLYIEFTIQDSGLGISAENLPRLFEDYTQAKVSIAREFGGTGLGLSIVRTLVDLMHGSLRVSSELGAGTSFTFCVPFQLVESGSLCGLGMASPSPSLSDELGLAATSSSSSSATGAAMAAAMMASASPPGGVGSHTNEHSPRSWRGEPSPAAGTVSNNSRFDFGAGAGAQQLQQQSSGGGGRPAMPLRIPSSSSRVSVSGGMGMGALGLGPGLGMAPMGPDHSDPSSPRASGPADMWSNGGGRREGGGRDSGNHGGERSLLTRALLGSARKTELANQLNGTNGSPPFVPPPTATVLARAFSDPERVCHGGPIPSAMSSAAASAPAASTPVPSHPGDGLVFSSSISTPLRAGASSNPFPALTEEDLSSLSPSAQSSCVAVGRPRPHLSLPAGALDISFSPSSSASAVSISSVSATLLAAANNGGVGASSSPSPLQSPTAAAAAAAAASTAGAAAAASSAASAPSEDSPYSTLQISIPGPLSPQHYRHTNGHASGNENGHSHSNGVEGHAAGVGASMDSPVTSSPMWHTSPRNSLPQDFIFISTPSHSGTPSLGPAASFSSSGTSAHNLSVAAAGGRGPYGSSNSSSSRSSRAHSGTMSAFLAAAGLGSTGMGAGLGSVSTFGLASTSTSGLASTSKVMFHISAASSPIHRGQTGAGEAPLVAAATAAAAASASAAASSAPVPPASSASVPEPKSAAPAPAAATVAPGATSVPGSAWLPRVDGAESIRVLLVEDNVANQKLGKFMLSKRGFVVVTASDGVEAVDTITADGAARRAAGAAPAAGAGGAAAPTRRLITLTTKRSSGGRGSLGGSGSAMLSSLPANLVSSTDNTPSPSSSFSVPSGPGGGGLTRTSSLATAIGSSSVSSAAFGPSITTITVEGAANRTGTSSPQSAAVTSQDVGLTPPSSGRPGAASVGAEPSAFDASYSSFDLVLMDLSMPRLSGIQATQLLRSAGFSGRILALTASDSDAQRGACIEAGMDGFLVSSFTGNLCSFGETKPFKADELVNAVLEQHRLTHADPPMPIRPPPKNAAATAAAATAVSASQLPQQPTAQQPRPPSQPRVSVSTSRPAANSTGPAKHTIVVRAKTVAERQEVR